MLLAEPRATGPWPASRHRPTGINGLIKGEGATGDEGETLVATVRLLMAPDCDGWDSPDAEAIDIGELRVPVVLAAIVSTPRRTAKSAIRTTS